MQFQQKLQYLLANPYTLNETSLQMLRKLCDDYPWCQSLQILLAKNLQDGDKLEFEKQVNKASAYAIDRRKFQRYLSDRDRLAPTQTVSQTVAPEIVEEQKVIEPSQEAEINDELLINVDSEPIADEKPLADAPVADNVLPATTQPQHIHIPLPETIEGNEPVEKKAYTGEKAEKLIELVKRRLEEIRNKKKSEAEAERLKNTQDVEPSLNLSQQIISETVDVPLTNEKEEEIILDVLEPTEIQIVESAEPNDQGEFSKEESPPLEITSHEVTSTDKNEPITIAPEKEMPAIEKALQQPVFTRRERKVKNTNISELIDKFLKEDPRIQVKKDLPEKQEDLSAKSTTDDSLLVSETLATVYLKQGKKDKALIIFEKLCLKYPEKSSYFAEKILTLKNDINL